MASDEREGGYIKLWRRLESWPFYRNLKSAAAANVITILLLMANWKRSEVWVGGKKYTIEPGQIFASEEAIAKRAKTTRRVVRRVLYGLATVQWLSRSGLPAGITGGRTSTLLTICNWSEYQSNEGIEVQTEGQEGAKPGPNQGQRGAPSKEGKEGKEGEEVKDLACSLRSPPEGANSNDLFKLPPAGPNPPGTSAAPPASATGDGGTTPPPPQKSKKTNGESASPSALDRLIEIWEQTCVPAGFAKAHRTPKQQRAAQIRIREPGWLEAFSAACSYAASEPFYRGGSSSGWVMTFGWLLQPGNAEKTSEKAQTRKVNGTGPPNGKNTAVPCATRGMVQSGTAEEFVGTPWDNL
jgi:hypothetical protein